MMILLATIFAMESLTEISSLKEVKIPEDGCLILQKHGVLLFPDKEKIEYDILQILKEKNCSIYTYDQLPKGKEDTEENFYIEKLIINENSMSFSPILSTTQKDVNALADVLANITKDKEKYFVSNTHKIENPQFKKFFYYQAAMQNWDDKTIAKNTMFLLTDTFWSTLRKKELEQFGARIWAFSKQSMVNHYMTSAENFMNLRSFTRKFDDNTGYQDGIIYTNGENIWDKFFTIHSSYTQVVLFSNIQLADLSLTLQKHSPKIKGFFSPSFAQINSLWQIQAAIKKDTLLALDIDDVLVYKKGIDFEEKEIVENSIGEFIAGCRQENCRVVALSSRGIDAAIETEKLLEETGIVDSSDGKEYDGYRNGIIYTNKENKGIFLQNFIDKNPQYAEVVFVDDNKQNLIQVGQRVNIQTELFQFVIPHVIPDEIQEMVRLKKALSSDEWWNMEQNTRIEIMKTWHPKLYLMGDQSLKGVDWPAFWHSVKTEMQLNTLKDKNTELMQEIEQLNNRIKSLNNLKSTGCSFA